MGKVIDSLSEDSEIEQEERNITQQRMSHDIGRLHMYLVKIPRGTGRCIIL